MKVIIAGASGFIGRQLIPELLDQGHNLVAISRDAGRTQQALPAGVKVISWDSQAIRDELREAGAVVNLAGENIAGGRWTGRRKALILNSRLIAAQKLKDALVHQPRKDIVYLQASAIGFYGHAGDETCSEQQGPGEGFLANVCQKWESYVTEICDYGVRTVTVRIGVVMGKGGGFLEEMIRQSKRRLAGKMGTGRQWISWIHIDDLVSAISYLINNKDIDGTFNLVAPAPVRQKVFSQKLARYTRRNLQLWAPGLAIGLILGRMGKELILSGQNVSSAKLSSKGFSFRYPDLDTALRDLIS